MSQVIHYQDDLYLINSLARWLLDMTRLDADAEIFDDGPVAVLGILEEAFRKVYNLLAANTQLLERDEYIRLMARTANAVTQAIASFSSDTNPFFRIYRLKEAEFTKSEKYWQQMREELKTIITESGNRQGNLRDHVSGDELSGLLDS